LYNYRDCNMKDPTTRFTDRVENYVRARPHYPPALADLLAREIALTPAAILADIGSGTGFSAEPFLRAGNAVYGIEPNTAMRAAAQSLLHEYAQFYAVDGTAEATTLPDASVDVVIAGQAFHWFRREPARAEFRRILRPDGWTVLFWNTRRADASPFMRDYEALLNRHGIDYAQVRHDNISADDIATFLDGGMQRRVLDNPETRDMDGLRRLLLSASYMPNEESAAYAPMMQDLATIFRRHEQDGRVVVAYDLEVYCGRFA
jgi:SAM-dependent methyltransferase